MKCRWGSHVGPWTLIWFGKMGRGKVFDVEKCANCGRTRRFNVRRVPRERRGRRY